MEKLENQDRLLSQIRQGNENAIRLLYKNAFHYCTSFVIKNNGTQEDARELFQESLFVLIKKANNIDFEIQHNVKTFLYAVVKNLWLKQLHKRKKEGLVLNIDHPYNNIILEYVDELEEKKELEEKHQQLYEGMQRLGEDCKKIILMTFYKKMKDSEIAPLLDYSLQYIRQKRRRCISRLKQIITTGKQTT